MSNYTLTATNLEKEIQSLKNNMNGENLLLATDVQELCEKYETLIELHSDEVGTLESRCESREADFRAINNELDDLNREHKEQLEGALLCNEQGPDTISTDIDKICAWLKLYKGTYAYDNLLETLVTKKGELL